MPIVIDPTLPVDVNVRIDSPDTVSYLLWYEVGGVQTAFANGTDLDAANPTGHSYQIPPLPRGSSITYRYLIAGDPQSDYAVELTLLQSGNVVQNGPSPGTGQLNANGTAMWNGTIKL